MRSPFRTLAGVVPLVMIVLLLTVPASGQFKVNTFDTAVADSQFLVVFNVSANNTEPYPFHNISDDAANKQEGAASLRSDWRMHTNESWGGMNMLSYTLPTQDRHGFYADKYRAMYGDSTYIDWGAGTHLGLWYYTEKPSSAPGNAVQMRFHIYEGGPGSAYYQGTASDYEDWYFQTPVPVNDTVPGWHQLLIPLVDTGTRNSPGASGFCITDWSGTHHGDKLDLDKIIGYTIEWTAGTGQDTASGIVLYDDLRLEGLGQKAGYEPVYSFNNFAVDTANFANGWTNGGASAISFFEETSDTLLGAGITRWDWAINVKESWGGGCNREYNLASPPFVQDLSSKGQLLLFAKIVQPLTCSLGPTDSNKITLRFVLFDYSDGTKEEWYTVAPIRMDSVGMQMGWQMIKLPLDWIQSGSWGDLKAGRFNTPNGTKDGILALDKIGGFKLEFSASRDAGEPYYPDLVYSGKVLFSAVIPSGYRETDHTPPAPVTSVAATPTTYSNLVTWADVSGETGATYTAWVSDVPFTTSDDPGVENIPPFGLPEGTQLATHLLRSPNTDQSLSLYYGVTATDAVGNINLPTVIGPIANTAKGVPTISLAAPTNFVADGDLTEWAGITPFVLSVAGANPTAHAATNSTINGDADLFVKAYIAVDPTYFYVAFDVDDDVVSIDTAGTTYYQDYPDLFIGLYDWRGHHHGALKRGAEPDYHLRYCMNQLINDGTSAILARPGPDYNFTVKQITTGYIIESRVPWTKFQEQLPEDAVFTPVEGKRLPIDFEINDNDTPGNNTAREGMMCYSVLNNDNSYSDAWRWTYTWIGNKMQVAVNDKPGIAYEYSLSQNYPNPFNPSTIIRYTLAKAGPVKVKVFDVLGREVATLVNGEVQNAGEHQVTFSASNARTSIASGVYFYKIESGSFQSVMKMMLLK